MITTSLHPGQRQMRDALVLQLVQQRIVARLRQRDASLWYPSPETQARIRERLGWLDLPAIAEIEAVLSQIYAAIEQYPREQIVYVAPSMLGRAVRVWQSLAETNTPRIVVVDTADPATVRDVINQWDPTQSLVVHAGAFDTPQASALAAALPADLHIPLPPTVGDRFGALLGAALVPAALVGADWRPIVDAGVDTRACFFSDDSSVHDNILELGATLGALAQGGYDLIDVIAPPSLMLLARWIEAIVAGALSKHRRGFVPGSTTPTPDATHNRFVVQLVPDQVEHASNRSSLNHLQDPIIRCAVRDARDHAAQIMTWQLAVSIAAMVLGVNPFDAPDADVINARIKEQGSRDTGHGTGGNRELARSASDDASTQLVRSLVRGAHFVAVAAFLPHRYDDQLQMLCTALRALLHVPTTLVYPLRDAAFSLQLLHAGRPGGVVLVLSSEEEQTVDPRIAQLFAFQRTQLAVELETWQRMGQPHLHLALGTDIQAELEKLLLILAQSRKQHN